MTEPTIRTTVSDFNVGFAEAVGPTLSEVFAREQADLQAAGVPDTAVAVGDRVPESTLLSADGAEHTLSDVRAGSAAVLVFYRGAWCPYCNITLKHYNDTLAPALAGRGIPLVAISPQTPEGTEAAILKDDLGFTVLSDPGNALAGRLGIVTEPSSDARAAHTELGFAVADSNADATPAIPFPTVVVVDADGVVRWVDVHVDYTSRTEVPAILDAVDAL
ncbi:peroxiredoxin-like family protein [Marisediminicola sp. LYQ134]|uniref:peroxiredoxin-like family protein n=1 Tax=unclassified Marisediminicola TaxID=2618316 RepID=UPI003983CF3E